MSNQELKTLIKYTQGIEVTDEQIEDLALLRNTLLQEQDRIVDIEGVEHDPFYGAEDGKLFGSLIGGLIGLAVAFIPGVNIAALTLFAIGATIGGLIGGMLAPTPKRSDEKFAPSAGFNGGGQLVESGATIPLNFGNREINPAGGVRVSGFLINSKILTRQGVQYLYQLYCLGLGPYGEIDTTSVLIDGQSLNNFLANEVDVKVKLGTQGQVPFDDFTYYSQALTPNTNTFFGVSYRNEVQNIKSITGILISAPTVENTIYSTSTGTAGTIPQNSLEKPAFIGMVPNIEGWNAGAFGIEALPANKDNWLYFRSHQVDKELAFGISRVSSDNEYESIDYCVRLLSDGSFKAYYQGTEVYSSTDDYTTTDYFLFIIRNRTVYFQKNSTLLHKYAELMVGTDVYHMDVAMYSVGAKIEEIKVGGTISGNADSLEDLGRIKVDKDSFESFTPTERYRIDNFDFRVISKNRTNNTLLIDPPLPPFFYGFPFSGGDLELEGFPSGSVASVNTDDKKTIFAIYTAKYETTKHVSFIDFNFSCNLYRRATADNAVNKLGVLLDIYMREYGSPLNSFVKLKRILIVGRNPNGSRRALRIKNLPLKKYYFELRPITKAESDEPIYVVDDLNHIQTIDTPVVVDGQTIQLEIESTGDDIDSPYVVFRNFANDMINITDTDNQQYSTENGPSCRITSVNECLKPSDIGLGPDVMAHKGYALTAYRFLSSDRLLNAPQTSILVPKALIIPNVMDAGQAMGTSEADTLIDTTADFSGTGDGWIVRNMTRHREAEIVAHTPHALTTATDLNWQEGDRYMVYYLDSSPYYADQYNWAISANYGGLGNYIDGDSFVDAESIAIARRHQKSNKLFSEGSLTQSTNFTDWANAGGIRSLCLPGRIDGRFSLTPERDEAIRGVYNAARVRNVAYEYAAWSEGLVNRISATWYDGSDGKFTARSCVVETNASFHATEPVVEETLDLQGVSTPEQAQLICQTYLKTRRMQDRQVSFETDLAAISTRPGNLFVFSHPSIEYNFEASGFVTAVEELIDDHQIIRISQLVKSATPDTYRITIKFAGLALPALDLPIVINDDQSIRVSGLEHEISVGDVVVIGREVTKRYVFRANSIKPNVSKNTINITGIFRPDEILDFSDLIVTCDPPSADPPIVNFLDLDA